MQTPPPPSKEFLAWNPDIYRRYKNNPVYYVIRAKTTRRDVLVQEIEEQLRKGEYGAYRLYQVFGAWDMVLRVWVAIGSESILKEELEDVKRIDSVDYYRVTNMVHWHWTRVNCKPELLVRLLDFEGVRRIQVDFVAPAAWDQPHIKTLLDQGLLRRGRKTEDQIIFYTFVDRQSANTDLSSIGTTYADLVNRHNILHPVVYRTEGKYDLILKGEAVNFFDIGNLVTNLNDAFAQSGIRTTTAVVTDTRIAGSEALLDRDFRQIASYDPQVIRRFPEFYELAQPLPEKSRDEFAMWIKTHLWTDALDDRELDLVHHCLRALIKCHDDEAIREIDFPDALHAIYKKVERDLRMPFMQSFLVKRVVPAEGHDLQKCIDEALTAMLGGKDKLPAADRDRTIKYLSLGNRLNTLTYFIKKMTLSADRDILDDWSKLVAPRNPLAHGDADGGRALTQNWQESLKNAIDFMRRVSKLIAFAKESIPADNSAK